MQGLSIYFFKFMSYTPINQKNKWSVIYMLAIKPPMGWNSWNTFGAKISEELIMETADAMIEKGYRDAGYEYVIIDDCWSLRERVDGKLVADPKLFPHGMKYLSDYVHSKGLKFGMYSCAGFQTCAGYPSSYGYEYEDAKQFAEWGVDYLKYDFCNFPKSANRENAYLTMSMALRNCGRDILFAACNWGVGDPAKWMRSRGVHTFRSGGDIFDSPTSFMDIFKKQYNNVENNGSDFYNDLDMLIVGMHGKGNVALGGCTNEEYMTHFAMWAFLGSPLIIGGDIRNLDDASRDILLNKDLISINQDDECRPPFIVRDEANSISMMKILSNGKFAIGLFSFTNPNKQENANSNIFTCISFDDIGIHSNTSLKVKLTDAITGEELGIFEGGYREFLNENSCKILIGEIVND